MSAALIALAIEDLVVAAGRVGEGSAYLFRGDDLYPFFEEQDGSQIDYVGSQSLISVELACVPIKEADTIVVSSEALDVAQEQALQKLLRSHQDVSPEQLARAVFKRSEQVPFVMRGSIGPETIYLSEQL